MICLLFMVGIAALNTSSLNSGLSREKIWMSNSTKYSFDLPLLS